jgi:hypothetical protein
MINKLKKWNWTAFLVIIVISFLGSFTNKNTHTVLDATILALITGLPIGLLWAWMTKEI